MRTIASLSITGLLLVLSAPAASAAWANQFQLAGETCDTQEVWYMSNGKGQGKPDFGDKYKKLFCPVFDRAEEVRPTE